MTGDKYAWDATKALVPLTKFTSDSMFDYYEGEVKPPYHRLKYSFLLKNGDEQIWMTETDFQEEEPDDPGRMFQFPYIHAGAVFTPLRGLRMRCSIRFSLNDSPMVTRILVRKG